MQQKIRGCRTVTVPTPCLLLLCIALVFSPLAHSAVIEGMQLPAWVERQGMRSPATLGMQLGEKDVLETGAGARLRIRLRDGSQVKMGEKARVGVASLRAAPGGLLQGVLDVLRGAFRFTTALAAGAQRRDVTIRVSTLAIGVRGTDVWGKAASDRNIVCLIDGRVEVEDRANNKSFTMTQPLTFYIAPHDRSPLPVQPAPAEKLEGWVQETDLLKGHGVMRVDGQWALEGVRESLASAEQVQGRLYQAGYPADVRGLAARPGAFAVRVQGFSSKKDARAMRRKIKRTLGIKGLKILSPSAQP